MRAPGVSPLNLIASIFLLSQVPWPDQLIQVSAAAEVMGQKMPSFSSSRASLVSHAQAPGGDAVTGSTHRSSVHLQGAAAAAAVAAADRRPSTVNAWHSSTESSQGQGIVYKDLSSGLHPSADGLSEVDLSDFSIGGMSTGNGQPSSSGVGTQLLFRGLRARIGIWHGAMDRVIPHCKSGRADYLGRPSNRAARLMAAAQGGQVREYAGLLRLYLKQSV